jgi:hypothetical protein
MWATRREETLKSRRGEMTSRASRYPYFGIPPVRAARPAANEPALLGKRLVLSTPEGFIEDMRAVSERYVDERNRDVIDITSEVGYFRWMLMGIVPARETWPSHLIWVQP